MFLSRFHIILPSACTQQISQSRRDDWQYLMFFVQHLSLPVLIVVHIITLNWKTSRLQLASAFLLQMCAFASVSRHEFTSQFLASSSDVSTHHVSKLIEGSDELSRDGQIRSVPPAAMR